MVSIQFFFKKEDLIYICTCITYKHGIGRKRLEEKAPKTLAVIPLSDEVIAFLWKFLFFPFSVFTKFVKIYFIAIP